MQAKTTYHYFVRVTDRDDEFAGTEATAYKQPDNYNMLNAVYNSEAIKTVCIHICHTAREAVDLANFWNKCYVENGRYPKEFTHNGKPIIQRKIEMMY